MMQHTLPLLAGISQHNKGFEPKDLLTCTAVSLQLADKGSSHFDRPTMSPWCYKHFTYTI